MTTVSQRSFSAGEIAPALYGRVDQVKYTTGLRTCRNFIVMRHGGITNRPGSQFISEVENSSEVVRLIDFVFNADQTYVLLFGDLTMRVIKDGVLQREATTAITLTTDTNPVVVTEAGHSHANGDELFFEGIVGMTELNGRSFKVANITANTFEITENDGTNVDGTGFTAYTSGGTVAKVFELVTPYLEADLDEIHYVQSADIVTLVHPTYAPRELSRTGDISWTLSTITFVPTTTHPTIASGTPGGAGSLTYKYKVTAVDPETSEESLPAVEAAKTITNTSQTSPVVVDITAHGYSDDDTVLISGIVGMTELNGRRFTVANKNPNDFELKEEDGTGHTAYVSDGSALREDIYVVSAVAPTLTAPHVITWTGVTGVKDYNIYRAFKNGYGFIGTSDRTTFNDIFADGDEDLTDTPPSDRNPFLNAGNFPSTVTFHQQRRVFANTDNNVEDVFLSRSGDFSNFTTRKPIQDDDTIRFNLAGLQVNEVQSITEANGLLMMMTANSEISITGNSSGALVPGATTPRLNSSNGSSKLQPMNVNGTIIYTQGRQNIVRSLAPEGAFDSFNSGDLTIFSVHLFENHTIVDMAFQQIPHSVAWLVRDDGVLLGLTFLREQEILAWHRHDFDGGTVENVVSVPEGTEDAVYVVVKRTINSKTVRYVERLKPRIVVDVEDFIFVDSSVTVDGTNTTATTMTVTGSGWTYQDDLTMTSSVAHFTSADKGNKEIHITDSAGDLHRFRITDFTSTTVVTVRVIGADVPLILQATATTLWGDAVGTVGNLWHLEGEEVSVFADGFVVASVNNSKYTGITVSNGTAVLDKKFVVIQAGLPITADMETLNVDSAQLETLADKKSMSTRITATVESTRGFWAGSAPPSDDTVDPLEGLTETKVRSDQNQQLPSPLITDNIDLNISGQYTGGARVFIRVTEPIPVSLLSIHAGGYFPFRGS